MAERAPRLLSVEEFHDWQRHQDERYELVEGVPVPMRDPLTGMTGASSQHDRITGNVLATLHAQLRGSPCWPATADLAIRTRIRSLRRADVLVTCDRPQPDVYEAAEPRMVVEVLSPSNKGLPWQRKLEEYRAHGKLVYLLLIDSEAPLATLIARDGSSWVASDFDGAEAMVELPMLACHLDMADVYQGIEFVLQGG